MNTSSLLVRRVPQAIFIGLTLGLILGLIKGFFSDDGLPGKRAGGDFVAFYAAGKILREQGPSSVYDPAVQATFQRGLGEDLSGDAVQYFAYPLPFALPFSLFSWFSLNTAFFLYALTLLCLLVVAVQLVVSPRHHVSPAQLYILFATFPFLSISILGGQNTVLTITAVSVMVFGMVKNRPVFAALGLAALAFKPPVAIFFFLLLLLRRQWRVIFVALVLLLIVYLLAAPMTGLMWPQDWLQALQFFRTHESAANQQHYASLLSDVGVLVAEGSVAILSLKFVLAIVVVGLAVYALRSGSSAQQVGMICLLLPVISPHLLFYDLGVLALGWWLCFSKQLNTEKTVQHLSLALWYLAFPAYLLGRVLLSDIFLLYALVVALLAIYCLHVSSER